LGYGCGQYYFGFPAVIDYLHLIFKLGHRRNPVLVQFEIIPFSNGAVPHSGQRSGVARKS
jgi:hypothetical protein